MRDVPKVEKQLCSSKFSVSEALNVYFFYIITGPLNKAEYFSQDLVAAPGV